MTDLPDVQTVYVTVADHRIIVRSRSSFGYRDRFKRVIGARWSPRASLGGAWTYPATTRTASDLHEALMGIPTDYDEAFIGLLRKADAQRAAAVFKDADDLPSIPGEVMPSWNHQRQAYWFLNELHSGALFAEMGTGKSKVACDLLRNWESQTVLIVCPKRVLGVWPKQFRLHGGQDVHVENGLVRVGRTDPRWEPAQVAKRVRGFEKALTDCRCGRPHVVVVNYEATAHDPLSKWALNRTWDAIILDESHRIRAPKGVWSMWAARIRTKTDRRLALTGSPLGQSPLDAFGQYRFLDPGIFGNSYTAFEHQIAVKGGYEGHEVIALRVMPTARDGERNRYYDPQVAAWFDERLFSIAYEVSADVLDLPEVREVERYCELPANARKMYRDLDRDLYTDLQAWQAGELQAANVMVKLLRLAQLTGGHLKDDDGVEVEVHTAKADLLTEVLEDIDPSESVVVFCRFVPDLDTVRKVTERLGRPYAELSGRRSDALTEDATLRLDSGVSAVQIQAGGTGVDFTKAAIAIDYSVGYSRIDYVQSRKRMHRPGQERPTLFIHLVAERTVDEDIYSSLADDNFTIETVMRRRLVQQQEAS